MNTNDATVFIVDDDLAIRESLSLLIEQDGYEVSVFESAEDFLAKYQPNQLGCAIIDLRMPGMDGMQLQEALTKLEILLPIIFLTGHGDIPKSVKAIKAGAIDFLTKPITREKLMGSIKVAVKESARILAEVTEHQNALTQISNLTIREKEVMMLAIQGIPNKEIARRLDISHRTVEIHKSKIMFKTGAINLLDLARIANECGLK
jgi:FixJ family two-component response regulator